MAEGTIEKRAGLLAKNRRRRIWQRIVGALGCLVVFCTVYALVLPAITASAETFCGKEEHVHSGACYSSRLICAQEESEGSVAEGHTHGNSCYQEEFVLTCVLEESEGEVDEAGSVVVEGHTHGEGCYSVENSLVCGTEESEDVVTEGHTHGDVCYERVLTCEKNEHEHEDACFVDKSADVETAEDWEATLPAELSGVWADDVLAVADSQLGYTESARNYVPDDGIGYDRGYTRYGEWYGDSYGDWCAMFASFCLHYAGVPAEAMPRDANCQNWIKTLSSEEFDMYYPVGEDARSYEPLPGDLVFFNWDADEEADAGVSDHVGIVYEIIPAEGNDPAKLKTIEGNSTNRVEYVTYAIDDETIMGYAALPVKNEETVAEYAEIEPEPKAQADTAAGVSGIKDGAKVYHSNGKFYQASFHTIANGAAVTFALIPVDEGYSANSLRNYNYTPRTGWTASAGANYTVAYCADHETYSSNSGAEYSVFTLDNSRIASEAARQRLATIVANAYPFITMAEMKADMAAAGVSGVANCDESELIAAAQQAIWMTTSPTSDVSAVGYSNYDYGSSCVNPLGGAKHTTGYSGYSNHISAIRNYLLGLEYKADLEVSSWKPAYEQTEDGLYNLTVNVELSRKVSAEENVTVQLMAGEKSSASVVLSEGAQSFTLAIKGVTAEELAGSEARILVDGAHVQAYFYDSESYQDMIGGNWESYSYDLSFAVGSEETSVSVSKVWADGTPGVNSVKVNLLANGVKQGGPIFLNAENDWFYSWTNLPKTDLLGNEIVYTVSEEAVKGYVSRVEANSSSSGGKVWQRVSANEGFVNGGEYLLVFPSGALGWAEGSTVGNNVLAWERVNLGNTGNTSENVIWVAEKKNSNIYLKNSGKSSNSYLALSNSKFSFAKNGSAVSYSNGYLKSGGSYLRNLNTDGYGVVTSSTSSALPLEVYRLVDADASSFAASFVITNYKVDAGAAPVAISVEKEWRGSRSGEYPEDVSVYLLQDGVRTGTAVTLNEDNDWSHTWDSLPAKLASSNAKIVYTVEEVPVEGYEASVAMAADDAYELTLTNTRKAVLGDIAIEKVSSADSDETLAGAVFDLYIKDASGSVLSDLGISEKVVKFREGLATSADGLAKAEDLELGETYYLVETRAPDGYELLPCPVRIELGGTADAPVIVVTEGTDGQAWAEVSDASADVLVVENAGGYQLPETGGFGSDSVHVAGLLLIVASLVLFGIKRSCGKRDVAA